MSELNGKIVEKEDNKLWILLDPEQEDYKLENALFRGKDEVAILFDDGISATPNQRKFAFAVVEDIFIMQFGGYSEFTDYGWLLNQETVYTHFKFEYYVRYGEMFTFEIGKSRKDKANKFINMLMDFVNENGVQLSKYRPLDYLDDMGSARHCYYCLVNKKCAICGKSPSDLHHVDTVGANGGDRAHINHLGLRAIQLCRTHHQEFDSKNMSPQKFMDKYHTVPIKIDDIIAEKHHLNTKNR